MLNRVPQKRNRLHEECRRCSRAILFVSDVLHLSLHVDAAPSLCTVGKCLQHADDGFARLLLRVLCLLCNGDVYLTLGLSLADSRE